MCKHSEVGEKVGPKDRQRQSLHEEQQEGTLGSFVSGPKCVAAFPSFTWRGF